MKKYIGVDLGGTNIRCSVVTEDGEILATVKSPSYAQEGREKVMDNLIKSIRQLPDWEGCSGIGVGVPGPCDQVTGSMMMSTNLPGFTGFPFARTLYEEFGLPSFIDNDANVAGLAEALIGAGKGKPVIYYVTLSTGIGGGLVVNGQCVSGKHGYGGEIANIIIDRNREKHNHLAVGAVENEASGTAITRYGREKLPGHTINHAGDVFELAAQGNEVAQEIVSNVKRDLGQLFATLAAAVDPDMFIIGGGMVKSAAYFWDGMIEEYKKVSHPTLHDTPFVIAKLEEPGVIGAAMLPRSRGY